MTGVVSYLVYVILIFLGHLIALFRLHEILWTSAAYLIANIVNYILHYYFTYTAETAHSTTLFKFCGVVIMGATVLALVVWLTQGRLSETALLLVKLGYALIWPVISALLLSVFVFRKKL